MAREFCVRMFVLAFLGIGTADELFVEHKGPVYCTSSSLCIEYCNTRHSLQSEHIYACCKVAREEQTGYPTCHCCLDAKACSDYPDATSTCGHCKQVQRKYNIAYVEQKCRKTSKVVNVGILENSLWADSLPKLQPQPRQLSP